MSSVNCVGIVSINVGSVQLPEQANAVIPAIPIELVNLVFSHLLLQYPHNMPPTRVCKSWHKIGVKQIIAKELSLYGQFIREMIQKLDPVKDEKCISALKVLEESLAVKELNVNDLVGLKSRLQALKDGTVKALKAFKNSTIIQLDFKLQTERPLLFKNLRTVISIKKAVEHGPRHIRDQIRRALKDKELNLAEGIVEDLPLACQGPMLELISVSSLLSQRKLAEAEKIAERISDEWARSVALEIVVHYLLSQDKLDEAIGIANRMPNLCIKSCAFNDIAVRLFSLIEQNKEEVLTALIKSKGEEVEINCLSDPDKRNMALKELKKGGAALINFNTAFDLLRQQGGNLLDKAKGAIEKATQRAFSLSEFPEKDLAIIDVAYSLILQDKRDEAREILFKKNDSRLIGPVLKAHKEMLAADREILKLERKFLSQEKEEATSLWLQNQVKNFRVRQLCKQFSSARI